jgi:hypothetical protein
MTIAKLNFDASFKAQADVVVKHSKMYEIIETAIA